jgi:hypothetical protein
MNLFRSRMLKSGWFSAGAMVMLPTQAAEVWIGSQVKWIYPIGNGQTVVLVLETEPAQCTSPSPKYLNVTVGQNGITQEGLRNILATASLAMATDKMLHVAFDDSTPACYVNRVFIVR